MKYVLYPLGFIAAGAVFLGSILGALTACAYVWHRFGGLARHDAMGASSFTLLALVLALVGVIAARESTK